MADASHIEVLKPGLATSVQDKGRQGYYHLGIPPSGALDQYALAAANLLVGNAEDAAVLECTLLGPELLFHRAALIAVTGATMAPKIDGKPMPCNMALAVPAGSRLSFEFVSAGARACLAVAGGIDVPVVLGSRSTYTLGAIGGARGPPAQGRRQAGHRPTLAARAGRARIAPGPGGALSQDADAARIAGPVRPSAGTGIGRHVLPGRLDRHVRGRPHRLPLQAGPRAAFSRARTALRRGRGSVNIVDACYPIGSIQVPAGVEPIILHRDAVSGGGYAMIGTVISADMDKVGQMQPNQSARFEKVTLEQALVARREHHARYDRLRQALSG